MKRGLAWLYVEQGVRTRSRASARRQPDASSALLADDTFIDGSTPAASRAVLSFIDESTFPRITRRLPPFFES
jgi:hypothetical protein